MPNKSKGRKANIYLDDSGIFYVIKDKNDVIKGKIIFNDVEIDSPPIRAKKIRSELKELSKKSKVKKFNIIISKDIRVVKIFNFGKEIKLNGDVDLLLKEEVAKYIQPSENINDYSIHYLKTNNVKQSSFLTAVVKKKILFETCTYAMQDKLNIDLLTIPEIAMYEILKQKSGLNAIAVYNENYLDLRVLVSRGSELIYSNQINNVSVCDITDEIKSLMEYVKSEIKESVNICYLIGADQLELDIMGNIQHIEDDKETDSKYHLLLNL